MSQLFTPLKMRSLTLRNRICVAPMCQYSCVDGVPNDWHLVHLGSRAVGGAALVMVEASAVSPEGRISPADCGLWNDKQTAAFAPIAAFIAAQGAVPAIQLAHAGRKASVQPPWLGGGAVSIDEGGWQPLAPSALPFGPDFPMPQELADTEIERICDEFVASAQRALRAGFHVVEVHMAHGYLLHQFLSPLSNRRTDAFGGSLENRMRFPLQVARRVREVWPQELPVMVRISVTDWVENGWDLAQSMELCRQLKQLGIDLIDCSSGGLVPTAVIPAGPGFQTPFAADIRSAVGIATGAVGLITAAVQAEQIIATDQADVVFLARELLRDPYWPIHAAQQLKVKHCWPQQYERAKP
ncbi:NADH:flavin oxidoreductase/NADH oxidase [Geopsychrobacter electrodiphilus]|uniref:NADH:flavin oxidoreductase/NADH oxidase n=1 Tax=Geopsychrobacter electrodiphilus TaxID=225196 RepID=UPI00036ADCE1|nr:NADH:flavin oxidoreductase/NADH oxidase [Geopsychrobacter electrodiphilus]